MEQSPASKLWVGNLIRLVFYMMLFVRAEKEGDWYVTFLHLVVKTMRVTACTTCME